MPERFRSFWHHLLFLCCRSVSLDRLVFPFRFFAFSVPSERVRPPFPRSEPQLNIRTKIFIFSRSSQWLLGAPGVEFSGRPFFQTTCSLPEPSLLSPAFWSFLSFFSDRTCAPRSVPVSNNETFFPFVTLFTGARFRTMRSLAEDPFLAPHTWPAVAFSSAFSSPNL